MICSKGVTELGEAFCVKLSMMNVEQCVLLGCRVFSKALQRIEKEIAHYTYTGCCECVMFARCSNVADNLL